MVMYGLTVIHECLIGDCYSILLLYLNGTEWRNLFFWTFLDSVEIIYSQGLALSCPEIN